MNKPVPIYAGGKEPIGFLLAETARELLRDVGDVVQLSFSYTNPPGGPEPVALYAVKAPSSPANPSAAWPLLLLLARGQVEAMAGDVRAFDQAVSDGRLRAEELRSIADGEIPNEFRRPTMAQAVRFEVTRAAASFAGIPIVEDSRLGPGQWCLIAPKPRS